MMRKVRLHAPGDLCVDDVQEPSLEEGTVRLTVDYTGICGSDLHEYKIGPVPIRAEKQNHVIPESEWDDYLPKNMGHEIAGTIEDVGPGVTGLEPGDRVTMNFALPCGECRYCLEGKPNLCVHGDGAVVSSAGFAEEMVVPTDAAIPVPDGVPLRHAALAEPLGVSMHGVQRSGLTIGDSVAVFGAGPIGLGVIAAAAIGGAGEIWVSEPRAARREAAKALGATHVRNPLDGDVRGEIRDATNGVDIAFETAGVDTTFTDALRVTKNDGTVVVLSVFEDTAEFRPNDVMQAERRVIGSLGFTAEPDSAFSTVLDFMADGRLDPEPIITDTVSLDETVTAFESLLEPDSEQIKVLVSP